MVKPLTKRLVLRALCRAGCVKAPDRGKHEKWTCPPECGQHSTALPRHPQITPGVVRSLIEDLKCLPEGWLK
jgi:hypothetical protein